MGVDNTPIFVIFIYIIYIVRFMKVDIDNKEITLKYTFRSFMIFEQVTGHSFSGKNLSEFIELFYSTLMASDSELTIDFNTFVDWLDENPQKLTEYTKWVADNITKQNLLTEPKEEKKTEKKGVKKNK